MARHTRSAVDAGARVRPGSDQRRIVDRARMSRRHVTALAENRRLRHQHPLVRRAVRIVACRTSVTAGRVLPQIWSALVGVTGRAQLGDRITLAQQLHVGRPVHVVTGRALHLAFAHGHVTGPIELGDLVPMTVHTELGLRRFFQLLELGSWRVNGVAARAAQAAAFMLAPVPQRMLAPVVAGRAGRVDLVRAAISKNA